ncbi:hypothetical protein [Nocardiopsis tropica]|uniref:SWIM zinc finger family protein n=1 Tax=Nocardiopsis tropica TaxID=109330 RepID=A0ABU7KKR9_9ACTN|nr:hypothetical protein [Nocardiopsis umidischolae]MEE2049890.1 SWIM zinc finger family protein [Nocardiopsis umidischolae]
MTAERPRIDPGLLAELLEAAPGRVRRKLDAAPRAAEEWDWSSDGPVWTVVTGNETVTLTGPRITEASQAACTCLLGPRCLHLLSVAGLLAPTGDDDADGPEPGSEPERSEPTGEPAGAVPPQDGEPGPTGAAGRPGGADGPAAPAGRSGAAAIARASGDPVADPLTAPAAVDGDARAAAALAWAAGARTLAAGVRAAGSSQRSELLRAAATARAARLPRLAAACTAVAAGPRDHATPAFALAEYTAALTGLLDTSWRLGGGPEGPRPAPTLADVGIGRRSYTEVGSLRLYGLGCERVVTASGYAGVVTHAVSLAGGARLWRIGDVAPGGPDRAAAVYGAGIAFGGSALSHRDLGRSGMVAQRVAASADGRLSGGSATTAAVSTGCAWDEEPLAGLWGRPLADQVAAAVAAQAAPVHRTGDDLVFADLTVTGEAEGGTAVVEAATGAPLVLGPDSAQDLLRARNLLRLAAEPGLALRAVARPVPDRPGFLVPVAVHAPGLPLPAAWQGRVNLSLDTLPSAGSAVPTRPRPTEPPGADPGLGALTRVLARIAEAGREAAPDGSALPARLRGHHLPTAADVLGEVVGAARERRRTATGESVVPPPDRLARAWLAATTYLGAAHRHLRVLAWAERVGGPRRPAA